VATTPQAAEREEREAIKLVDCPEANHWECPAGKPCRCRCLSPGNYNARAGRGCYNCSGWLIYYGRV
jgi:hypothetical protein